MRSRRPPGRRFVVTGGATVTINNAQVYARGLGGVGGTGGTGVGGGDLAETEGVLIVTRLGGLDRGQRVGLATIWFFAMLAGLAWLLRRLQARHLI